MTMPTCRYCGDEIVWTETQGWQLWKAATVAWGTWACWLREPNPEDGHAAAGEGN